MNRTASARFARALLTLMVVAVSAAVLSACIPAKQARLIPSVLDPQAIDVKAAGTPATIPPISTGVPKRSILRVDQWILVTGILELHSQRWLDFQNHRARWDWYPQAPSAGQGGASTSTVDRSVDGVHYATVIDGSGARSYDGDSGRIDAGPMDDGSMFDGSDQDPGWSGRTPVRLGRQTLAGKTVDVYRIDLHNSVGQERSADFALIYVDSATGLRVRDEWLLGSPGDAWVAHMFDYRLIERTDAVEQRMTVAALEGEQAGALAQRLSSIKALDFPVWGLPAKTAGLVLSGVSISTSAKGTSVLLYYRGGGAVGQPALSIETTDVRTRNDFSPELLVPRAQAASRAADGGDVLDFGMGSDAQGRVQTEVRLQSWLGPKAPADLPGLATLAQDLVDIRGS